MSTAGIVIITLLGVLVLLFGVWALVHYWRGNNDEPR